MIKKSMLIGENNNELKCLENQNIISRLIYCINKNHKLEILKSLDGKESLTYEKFFKKVNSFSKFLQSIDVFDRKKPIALILNGDALRYIAIYGVLASGGYYLPIEPEPNNICRIIDVLNDSGCNVAFVNRDIYKFIKSYIGSNIELFCIDDIEFNDVKENYINENIKADDPAYIIYTSGSTGIPKGVVVPHKAIINMILSLNKMLKLSNDDLGISFTSFSFDSCGCDIYTFILNMIPIVFVYKRESYIRNLEKLNNICIKNKVTILFLPTVLAERFVGLENKYLKILYFGGEKFCKNIKTSYLLCNSYGLTETGILNTFYEINGDEKDIPLGNPINNTGIVILDDENKIVELGTEGEIAISGASLAIGYKDDKYKTAEKFIYLDEMNGVKVCKTGDIGYIGKDLNLYYKYRKDKQVKISGYRIELGEIKYKCQQLEGIEVSIPMVIKDENISIIVNFYISKLNYSDKDIFCKLKKKLPFYMLPMYSIKLDNLPYTTNGKIDYQELEKKYFLLKESLKNKKYFRNHNIRDIVYEFVSESIDINKSKLQDEFNFFELGGDSLNALKLKLKIKDFLGIDIKLEEIYDKFTLGNLIDIIKESLGEK